MVDLTSRSPVLSTAPNPLTSLAWLPPDLAADYEVERYLVACTVGAWLWDVLMNLSTDIRMFRKNQLTVSDFAYILSRLLSGGFIVGIFIFLISPLPHCQMVIKAVTWIVAFALPANSFLFFLRARGVFFQYPVVKWVFFALWLTTFTSITTPFAFEATQLGPTRWCINSVVRGYSAATFVTIFVFDTTIFLAVSFKVSTYGMADNWRGKMKTFATGGGVGHVSKTLLKSGQVYYLATVALNLIAMTLLITPSLSQVTQGMLTVPNVALQNAMACHVFRLLKCGHISDNAIAIAGLQSSSSRRGSHPLLSPLPFTSTRTDNGGLPSGSVPTDTIRLHDMSKNNSPIRITTLDDVSHDRRTLDYKSNPSGDYTV